ncbi:PREDICTED: probable LRR receptor-like serine/threonine-protein kinase At1g56140 [Prunus mume]|uniref:Probable LRR receptor-like serine/threonine-protein kinase At1g56140 n=1 Tax=Prunus mume TaxID=102107 RepID=A0ABM1LLB1_PRUMU|nr:PREDICTED: probable LRR receptor-like serine/threonine-protein kinase At1g56140 [Prunus mume]
MINLRRMLRQQWPLSASFGFFCSLCCLSCFWFQVSMAQNATTDPSEVEALTSIFRQWDMLALTIRGGEPCIGFAINGSEFENQENNPAVSCDCTYDKNTTCHITKLRVHALNKRGMFPKEFEALRYLAVLKLDKNYFTGPLPAFIGNMSALIVLSIAHNSFSGPIPKELGNLKELAMLSLGSNDFSGTLPPELGNLVNLGLFYMDSCGLGGEIPSTFAKLINMQVFWAQDNPLSGKIPSFIGNWRKLTFLRFQGNSFEGPIPTSFSQLTSLESLRISDISNVSSSLDFIKNLKNLTDLVLRNTLINGSIPTEFGEYQRLQILDLGFNNLTGELPSSLFNMSSLKYLFLGNNSLSGPLPSQKSNQLQTIDLSYNYFSGSFPPWVTTILQLLPGLNCLQRNFPCNQNTPRCSDLTPTTPGKKSRIGLIVGIAVPVGVVILLLLFAVLYMRRKTSEKYDDEDLLGLGPRPNTFSYAELRAATEDFNPSNKLGEGGYGPVYKGTLSDGRVVAVKQLSVASHQGKSQFVTEIATISAVQHRNLVKLYGCCIEGTQRILVYEHLDNKSLDQALFGRNDLHLDWPTRFNILLGTARGLAYLHEESRPRIVHRDVKASNILLDAKLSPKISDFGLAKLYDDEKTHISTRVAGTIGYLAPEYAMRGHLTEKADVFGFGVVALEIISGRPNSDNNLDLEKIYLLEWAWTLHEKDQSLGLVDPRLTKFDESDATRLIKAALLCTQASPMMRPSMSRVVAMLSGDIEASTVMSKPSYLTDWDFKDVTTSSFLVDGDTSSTETTLSTMSSSC